jgi:adenosylcobinamide kinase/adenosylcobinamide-phosphate guanylyltransferase
VLTVVTGPVRGGKSRFALELALATGKDVLYVATLALDPADAEMCARVERHRAERGPLRSVEVDEARGPTLATVLASGAPGEVLVVDSLGSWLGGLLYGVAERAERDPVGLEDELSARSDALRAVLAAARAEVVAVAEEAGWGLVPPTPLGRLFRDLLGRLTAQLARDAGRAYLVVAGHALDLKALGRPIGDNSR